MEEEALIISEHIRRKHSPLVMESVCAHTLRFSLIASSAFISDYRLTHSDSKEINQPSILFRVQMDEIFLHELDAKRIRAHGVVFRGKDFIHMLILVANNLEIPIKLYDRSDIRYSLLVKTGKTWYERFGFEYEEKVPEEIREMCRSSNVSKMGDKDCLTAEVVRCALGSDHRFEALERILCGKMVYKPSIKNRSKP